MRQEGKMRSSTRRALERRTSQRSARSQVRDRARGAAMSCTLGCTDISLHGRDDVERLRSARILTWRRAATRVATESRLARRVYGGRVRS